MKTLYFLLFLILIGCQPQTNKKIETNENFNKVDSILNHSQQTLVTADQASAKSDSTINQKVEKTVKQITTLKQEVKTLKEENNALKTQLNDANDAGKPFKLLPVSSSENNR